MRTRGDFTPAMFLQSWVQVALQSHVREKRETAVKTKRTRKQTQQGLRKRDVFRLLVYFVEYRRQDVEFCVKEKILSTVSFSS